MRDELSALSELDASGDWAIVGAKGERAAGNGAAMRVAPLAFCLSPEDPADRSTIRDVAEDVTIVRTANRRGPPFVGGLSALDYDTLVVARAEDGRILRSTDASPSHLLRRKQICRLDAGVDAGAPGCRRSRARPFFRYSFSSRSTTRRRSWRSMSRGSAMK